MFMIKRSRPAEMMFQFASIQFNSMQLDSTRLGSAQFNGSQLISITAAIRGSQSICGHMMGPNAAARAAQVETLSQIVQLRQQFN